jgi:hypothetical protein
MVKKFTKIGVIVRKDVVGLPGFEPGSESPEPPSIAKLAHRPMG